MPSKRRPLLTYWVYRESKPYRHYLTKQSALAFIKRRRKINGTVRYTLKTGVNFNLA